MFQKSMVFLAVIFLYASMHARENPFFPSVNEHPKRNENYVVRGTIVQGDSEKAAAAIVTKNGRSWVVKVDDVIDDFTVVSIRTHAVFLSRGLETLTLEVR